MAAPLDVPTGAAARPWAYAVTRNLMRNHWRKGQRSDALRTVLIGELHQAQSATPNAVPARHSNPTRSKRSSTPCTASSRRSRN
ncbi:MAG: hypothetical protein R2710_16980 [Acidimicrobiales bacterium]